ncbi:MAG: hypothetical protein AB8G86_24995 [Saprospiraceae bacterium]
MNLNQLYKTQSGEEFWRFLGEWKYTSFSKQQKKEIDSILEDLMEKVKVNFDLIYERLKSLNYNFYNSKEARVLPTDDIEKRMNLLSKYVEKGGLIPLSLKKFYLIVGGVDFMKKYNCINSYPIYNEKFIPDPVVIPYLNDDFLDYIKSQYSEEHWGDKEALEYVYERGIPLAPDDLHKDNISGGEPYCIKLSKHTTIDNFFPWGFTEMEQDYQSNNLFGFEPNNQTFIEYLRYVFKWGGFSGIKYDIKKQNNTDKQKIIEFVNYLTADLKEI